MRKFNAIQFVDSQFHAAEEKAKTANAIIRFIESDFDERKFSKRMYHQLMNMFGHIAHYDQFGFYAEWFSSDVRRLEWLEYVLKGVAYGFASDPHYGMADVEQAIASVVLESGLTQVYRVKVANALEAKERAQLGYLKYKYEDKE